MTRNAKRPAGLARARADDAGAPMQWQVNTVALLNEILLNRECSILAKPLNIFGKILAEVGERAAALNDPILNELMCRLAIYEVADPYSPAYDAKRVAKVRRLADKARAQAGPPRRILEPVGRPSVPPEAIRLAVEIGGLETTIKKKEARLKVVLDRHERSKKKGKDGKGTKRAG